MSILEKRIVVRMEAFWAGRSWLKKILKRDKFLLKYRTALPMFDPELGKIMQIEEQIRSTEASSNQTPVARDKAQIRAEKVARGKALIADPNYPSAAHMAKVASVLAAKWGNGTLDAELPECAGSDHKEGASEQNASPSCRAQTSRGRTN
jgi:hypothetical protein